MADTFKQATFKSIRTGEARRSFGRLYRGKLWKSKLKRKARRSIKQELALEVRSELSATAELYWHDFDVIDLSDLEAECMLKAS